MSTKEPKTPAELLELWHNRVRTNQKGHYMMAEKATSANWWVGTLSAFIAAAVAVLVIIAAKSNPPDGSLMIFIAVLSIIGGALATINTTAKWSERSQQHMGAATQYGSVLREIAQIRSLPLPSQPELDVLLNHLRERMDAIPGTAPLIPRKKWKEIPAELTPASDGKFMLKVDDEGKTYSELRSNPERKEIESGDKEET